MLSWRGQHRFGGASSILESQSPGITRITNGSPRGIEHARTLIIIGVGGRTLVVDEVGSIEDCGNFLEGDGRLGKVETIGKVVGRSVGVAEGGQVESGLDEFEDAAEVVRGVRNVSGFGVG